MIERLWIGECGFNLIDLDTIEGMPVPAGAQDEPPVRTDLQTRVEEVRRLILSGGQALTCLDLFQFNFAVFVRAMRKSNAPVPEAQQGYGIFICTSKVIASIDLPENLSLFEDYCLGP